MKPIVLARKLARPSRVFLTRAFLNRALRQVSTELKRARLNKSARERLKSAKAVSVVFVSTGEIQRLNREFRKKDRPTDILSFEPTEHRSLGELVIAMDVIRRQAKEHGLTMNQELGYMVLHGVLHLLGYDHGRKMFSVQDSIFEKFKDSWE